MRNNEGKGKSRKAWVCYLSKTTSTKPSLQLCTRRQTGMLWCVLKPKMWKAKQVQTYDRGKLHIITDNLMAFLYYLNMKVVSFFFVVVVLFPCIWSTFQLKQHRDNIHHDNFNFTVKLLNIIYYYYFIIFGIHILKVYYSELYELFFSLSKRNVLNATYDPLDEGLLKCSQKSVETEIMLTVW